MAKPNDPRCAVRVHSVVPVTVWRELSALCLLSGEFDITIKELSPLTPLPAISEHVASVGRLT